MAFGVKYRFNVYSYHIGTYWRVDLSEDGYSGSINSSVDLDAAAAVNLNLEGVGGEKFFTASEAAIKGSSVSLTVCIDSDELKDSFSEFSTEAEGKFMLSLYKGTAPGNESLYGHLVVQPDVFMFPYEDYPYFITILATDELGSLSGIPFLNSSSEPYLARQPIMYFIFEILGKLTLGAAKNVKTVCNLFAEGMVTDDPLYQATIDPTKYVIEEGRENETVWNCADVLNDILKSFGAVLTLGEGDVFLIRRLDEMAADSFQENTYTIHSEVNSSATITDHVVATNTNTDDSIMAFINSASVSAQWRWKRVSLRIYTGGNENFVFRGGLSPDQWLNDNELLNWDFEYKGPSFVFVVKYGATTPFPAVPIIQRVEIFEQVDHIGGVYIDGDTANSTIYSFSVQLEGDILILDHALGAEPFEVDSEVFITKANTAVLPTPLGNDRSYQVHSYDGGDTFLRLKNSGETSVIDLTGSASGNLFVGQKETTELTYGVQVNGYQTAEYTTGDITNKIGLKTDAVYVLAGTGNSFSLSFFWKILFSNSDTYQANPAYGYWQLTITNSAGTVYYYDKAAFDWQTTATANILEDDLMAYGWKYEHVDSLDIPTDGSLVFTVYQPSSFSNSDLLGVQVANIDSSLTIGGVTDAEYIDKTAEVGENYAYTANRLELYTGDLPATSYRGHVGFSGQLANNWYRRGVSETKELTDILLQTYLNNYGRTTLKVQGTLMGDFLPHQVIQDANMAYEREGSTVTPRLVLLGGSYNLEDGVWSGEWVEMVAGGIVSDVEVFGATFDITFK